MDFSKINFNKDYMTVREISSFLKINKQQVRKTIKANNFRRVWEKYRSKDKGLGRWRINMEDYANYINKLNEN